MFEFECKIYSQSADYTYNDRYVALSNETCNTLKYMALEETAFPMLLQETKKNLEGKDVFRIAFQNANEIYYSEFAIPTILKDEINSLGEVTSFNNATNEEQKQLLDSEIWFLPYLNGEIAEENLETTFSENEIISPFITENDRDYAVENWVGINQFKTTGSLYNKCSYIDGSKYYGYYKKTSPWPNNTSSNFYTQCLVYCFESNNNEYNSSSSSLSIMRNDVFVYYVDSSTPIELRHKILRAQQNMGKYVIKDMYLTQEINAGNYDFFISGRLEGGYVGDPTLVNTVLKIALGLCSKVVSGIFTLADIVANAANDITVESFKKYKFDISDRYANYNFANSTDKVPRTISLNAPNMEENMDGRSLRFDTKISSYSSNHTIKHKYSIDIYTKDTLFQTKLITLQDWWNK